MTQKPPDPAATTEPESAHGGWPVWLMIGIASLLFLATATLLYYRSATMVEPNCVILVNAAPSLKGADVVVDSVMLSKALKVRIGDNDRYSIPFYVDPGEYNVSVVLDNETQVSQVVTVDNANRGRMIDLTRFHPTSQPAPASGGL